MTPTEIAEMQADALAGTPGEWAVDGPAWNQIVWTDNENRLCFMAHSNGLNDGRDFANARRIARVPRLEATVTAQAAEVARLREALVKISAEISIPVPTWKNGINFKKLYELWRKQATARADIARAALEAGK